MTFSRCLVKNRTTWFCIFVLSLIVWVGLSFARADSLILAEDGTTEYTIVVASNCSAVESYAAEQLALYLQPMTGATFPVVTGREPDTDAPAIFVGLSPQALKKLGSKNPLADLVDDEHVYRTVGRDIILYGRGVHGTLHAVMGFLEDKLGWRWFSRFEYVHLPQSPALSLEPFEHRRLFSFAFRSVDIQRGYDFPYQHGCNRRFDARLNRLALQADKTMPPRSGRTILSRENDNLLRAHSLFQFVPPDANARRDSTLFGEVTQYYFDEHPEYFTLWENGKRVPNRQLCLSNPELRSILTEKILAVLEGQETPSIITVAAQDNPGKFCYCADCMALEEKYGSSGGPIYDYLLELCPILIREKPGVRVHTLAYRRAQTQKPPKLEPGEKLPSNLIVDFAPIEDNYFADWDHPDPRIQETWTDLQTWSKIVHPGNLWAWMYPDGWGTGHQMPIGNVQRVITNMRKMHDIGVAGLHFDHQIHSRALFAELREYLILKLMQNADADTDNIIEEFTDYMYGPAAQVFRQLLEELEAERLAMKELPPGVGYHSRNYDDQTFPYITLQNLHRWQGYFDEMMRLVESAEEVRWKTNVMLARREIDTATLWKWFALQEIYPETYQNHETILERIAAANATEPPKAPEWEKRQANRRWSTHAMSAGTSRDFGILIQAGGKTKPLPPPLDNLPEGDIRQVTPDYSSYARGQTRILDPEAGFGYAVPVHKPDLPFAFGFYQRDTKTFVARRNLELEEIETGEYQLFKLGTITITSDCQFWFSARSWATSAPLGEKFYEPGSDNIWEAWASLKFLGPTYGSAIGAELLPVKEREAYDGLDKSDLVLVDRIILVRKSKDQFAVE